ncbi:MAG: DUF3107 domain-containing protein [Ornithinimicrobium sp.]|uniref:DUF3107 domain-containing protein n=1 Tax=Ornithinimicrobium sp. TaxID=1977084 RepID=UPI0026DF52C8|nr:DUF3107 domain-containing protein [Ornithinimicrobium sp.]MDO5739114.1 DUF3107 domain-containing protein [Ornithinimicrobium sp.]
MQVRIGIRDIAREVVFESSQTPEHIRATVTDVLSSGGSLLEFEDEKGATVIIAAASLAYVEIGVQEKSAVGFGIH